MEFTYTSNLEDVAKLLLQMAAELDDPAPLVIGNDAPYIRVLERGHTYHYTRRRKRPKSRQGQFRLPKGGLSIRREYSTTVKQPEKRIMRDSIPLIKVYGKFISRHRSFKTKVDLASYQEKIGKFALGQFQRNTPVVSGNARRRWRFI